MSNFDNNEHFSNRFATMGFIMIGAMFGFTACDEPQTSTPMMKTVNAAETCQDNDDGWYCFTNSDLNVASGDEFFDMDLIHCVGDSVKEVNACDDICDVRASGMNDVCTTSSAVTCQDNDDGWYCYTNQSLNVSSADEYYDTDLIHCVGDSVKEVKACMDVCDVRPSGMNDVCTTASTSTCQGNDKGWYCYTNPSLNVAPGDEFFDTDLIYCENDSASQVKSCSEGCEVKPQNVDDVCASSTTTPVCGNGLIEGTEQCDLLNLNGQTCATNGYGGGTLTCTPSCQLDSTGCCNHSCTGDTQCIGTVKQTCQDGNGDGCNEWVNTGTCPPNAVCGNSLIEGSEVCDSTNMNGHSCTTEGYDGGTATCSGSCTVSTGACCNDACTSGTQCINNVEQICQTGTNGCKTWVDTGTCGTPTCTTQIVSNSCYTYTSTSGTYGIFRVCGEMIGADRLVLHVTKEPLSPFGSRPYNSKVYSLSDPDCSHTTSTYNNPTGGVSVTGIGTNELEIVFDVTWGPGQTDKKYCAYASTISSDLDYDSNDPQQTIWWYSRGLHVKRVCN